MTLGSIKSNMGHAGPAGWRVWRRLPRCSGTRPSSVICTSRENPALKLEGTSLRVATEAMPLREGTLVGVSSFGMSGTNAHVLGTGASTRRVEVEAPAHVLLPLSAFVRAFELGRRAAVGLQNSA